jgi:hypothetical protein
MQAMRGAGLGGRQRRSIGAAELVQVRFQGGEADRRQPHVDAALESGGLHAP